ncbi:hypothetical protein HK096_009234 [Nowakowskiella sp. JEL0078]|nr:hypothetical protein HK096_009234 [Nowakowskiella sp. JEL0078]
MDQEDLSKVLDDADGTSHANGSSSLARADEPPPRSSSPYKDRDSFRRRSLSPGHERVRVPYERTDYRDSRDSRDRPSSYSRPDSFSKYQAGDRDRGRSVRESRVYVGNLAYEVGWRELKDFARKVGEVSFADVMTQSNGRSKGCGIVEYANPEDAQRAIKELSDTVLMGRPVFIREDRENESRFGSGNPPPSRSRYDRYPPSNYGSSHREHQEGYQVFVGNLPFIVAWQDLKDLFRRSGHIIRADVIEDQNTRRSKGFGLVVYATAEGAERAIGIGIK